MSTDPEATGVDTLLLQEWTTISGYTSVSHPTVPSVWQSADEWLDVSRYDDLVFYLDVKQVTGTVTFSYETAPSRQDSAFLPLIGTVASPGFSMVVGLRIDPILWRYSTVPPARFVRWHLAGAATYGATFRAWVAGYSPRG